MTAHQKLDGASDQLNELYNQLVDMHTKIKIINWNKGYHDGSIIKDDLKCLETIAGSIQTVDQGNLLSVALFGIENGCKAAQKCIEKSSNSRDLGNNGELRQKIGEIFAYTTMVALGTVSDDKQFVAADIAKNFQD